jgi:CelD/BcsL family acetyltransferase involved in cellulose biosynthesis
MPYTLNETNNFDALRGTWDALLRESYAGLRIFSTWDWQRIYWESFGRDCSLRLISIAEGETLVGILPLAQRGEACFLVGGEEVCDYLDIIVRRGHEEGVLRACLNFLRQSASSFDLRFVPAASPTTRILPTISNDCGWVLESSIDDVCPGIDLPDTWDDYLAQLSKKDRHELRRKLRRLDEAGEVALQIAEGGDSLASDTAEFVRLHRLSRVEKATFMDERMEEFFDAIIAFFAPRGQMKIYFLALNGVRVAATLCIEQAVELWVYNSGFDRDYTALSVGLALKTLCIKDAIAQGKRRVDFLRGSEPYKYDLGATDVPVYRFQLAKT